MGRGGARPCRAKVGCPGIVGFALWGTRLLGRMDVARRGGWGDGAGGGDGELRVDQVLGAREDFRQWGLRGGGVPGWVPCSS